MIILLKIFIYLLCIINFPFCIIAAIWIGYKQIKVSQKLGVSATMIEVINGRYTMDLFDLKKDPYVVKLMKVLPNTSPFALRVVSLPFYLYHKITGGYMVYPKPKVPGEETLLDIITARTKFFDAIIDIHKANCEQFVVLGAGLDTRSYNDFSDVNIKKFEADLAHNSEFKRQMLKKAGIDSSDVYFVVLDFEKKDWFQQLTAKGLDPEKKTLLLWEGVTLYLPEGAVHESLKIFKDNLKAGSIVTFDLYDMSFIRMGQSNKMHMKKTLEATNESLKFGLDLRKDGVKAVENLVAPYCSNLEQCFILGEKSKRGAYMSVNSIIV